MATGGPQPSPHNPPKMNGDEGYKSENSLEDEEAPRGVREGGVVGGSTTSKPNEEGVSKAGTAGPHQARLPGGKGMKGASGSVEGSGGRGRKRKGNKKRKNKNRRRKPHHHHHHHHQLYDYDDDQPNEHGHKHKAGDWCVAVESSKSYPRLNLYCPPGQFLLNYGVQFPPLPAMFDVRDPKQLMKYFNQPQKIEPPMTLEEDNAMLVEDLRKMLTFDGPPITIPKWDSSSIQCFGVTPRDTVLIRFKDRQNLAHFENLDRRVNYCARNYRKKGMDASIKKEDIQVGLIVLAHVPRNDWWIRARVKKFTNNWIEVTGVDMLTLLRLPYSEVFYIHESFQHCPFQLVECYLSDLERWENSSLIRLMWYKLEQILLAKEDPFTEDSDEDSDKHDHEGTRVNVFTEDFWISDVKQRDGKYYARIAFPDEFWKDQSVNDWLKTQLENFDPFKDLLVTP